MKVAAVVPAFNEEKTINHVVHTLLSAVDVVVVVDDGSRDNTAKKAENSGAIVLRHFLNRGQGAALFTGIRYALNSGHDIVVTFDADGQHDEKDIEKIIAPILENRVDVVLGSRFLEKKNSIPVLRRAVLAMAILFTRMTTGLKITDTHNGFRAFSADALEKIQIRQDKMAHASEILEEISKKKLRYCEIGVTVRYTDYSRKKGQKASQSFKILWDLFLGKMSK